MVSTSALRESVVLIIFLIVLVPIAAKRAQDGPGYRRTFSVCAQQSLACRHGRQPWSSSLPLMINDKAARHVFGRQIAAQLNNETIKMCPPKRIPPTQVVKSAPLTVHVRISVGPGDGLEGNRTLALAENHAPASRFGHARMDKPTHAQIIKVSVDTNKERWTLIWTGTAIAAVAMLMSSC